MLVINLRYLPQVSIVKSCFFDFILIQFFWVLATILGKQALPMLLKLASVMVNKKHEWHAMRQLPVEIELNKAFQFHSVFACPVSRDQSTAENPPMLLPCGHVLSLKFTMTENELLGFHFWIRNFVHTRSLQALVCNMICAQ
jgi:hypothetical protein